MQPRFKAVSQHQTTDPQSKKQEDKPQNYMDTFKTICILVANNRTTFCTRKTPISICDEYCGDIVLQLYRVVLLTGKVRAVTTRLLLIKHMTRHQIRFILIIIICAEYRRVRSRLQINTDVVPNAAAIRARRLLVRSTCPDIYGGRAIFD